MVGDFVRVQGMYIKKDSPWGTTSPALRLAGGRNLNVPVWKGVWEGKR